MVSQEKLLTKEILSSFVLSLESKIFVIFFITLLIKIDNITTKDC